MKNNGYRVDAIVYLTQFPNEQPSYSTWTESDISNVKRLVVPLPAVNDDNKISLLTDFVEPIKERITHLHFLSVIGQYGDMIKFLLNKHYTSKLMKNFDTWLLEEASAPHEKMPGFRIEDIITLKQMIQDLPCAMADNLVDILSGLDELKSFKIGKWQPNSCVINLNDNNAIYIYCSISVNNAYSLGIADFSKDDRFPQWLNLNNLNPEWLQYYHGDDDTEYKLNSSFEFGYYKRKEIIELIKVLQHQYKISI